MKKIFQKFNDTTIFFRLSCIMLFVFLVLITLFYLNFVNFTSEKKTSTYNMVKQTNHQAINKIDDYIKDIINITKLPLTYKQNDKTYLSNFNTFNQTNTASLQFQKMNEQMFESILTYKDNIDSCFVFNLLGYGDYKVRTPIYKVINPTSKKWFLDSIDAFGKPIIIDTYELPYVADQKAPLYVFGVSRGIVRIESSQVIGVLLVNVKVDYFHDICKNMKITDGHRIIILHNNDTIYDTVESNIGSTASQDLTNINWNTLNNMESVKINGTELFASSVLSDSTGWRIISLIPSEELFYDLKEMQRSNTILTSILIIITIGLLFSVSKQIISPIKKLIVLMKLAENGDFNVHVNIKRKDEVGELSSSFNSMTSKINSLIQEVYVEQIKQSEMELQMLQAQINPHFLYNTLESISMMATINDDDTTSEMASNLGSILRYGISNYNQEVSIEEEIKNLKKYITLQEIRFHSIYNIEINIDHDLYSITIIKMILQPILENSIYHGMKSLRSNGKIIITAHKVNKSLLVFEVKDNGEGMNESQVQILNGYINDENDLLDSIGLRNVNKRIKLKYGEQYGIIIESSPGAGTTVIVSLKTETN